MCLQRLGRFRDNARLFHLVGNGTSTIRVIVWSHHVQKYVQTVFHVFNLGTELVRHNLYEQSGAAFLIGCSVHQEQLSVSFETVVSNFPHEFSCSFLCEHREKAQQGCRLLFVWWSRHHHAGSSVPAYLKNVKSQLAKSLPGASGPIDLTASVSPGLLTNFFHSCSELMELTSQHLNFLIGRYRNSRNRSIPHVQDNLLRYHARVGNHASRGNAR